MKPITIIQAGILALLVVFGAAHASTADHNGKTQIESTKTSL